MEEEEDPTCTRTLRRLTVPVREGDADYASLCSALHSLRGALLALQDARDVSKWACRLPRHPDARRPTRLRDLAGRNSLYNSLARQTRVLACFSLSMYIYS